MFFGIAHPTRNDFRVVRGHNNDVSEGLVPSSTSINTLFQLFSPSDIHKRTSSKMITSVTRTALRLRLVPNLQRSASVWANVKAG